MSKDFSIDFEFRHIVLQPTTRCNLDCTYCYLPNRDKSFEMSPDITRRIAENITLGANSMEILWHAGEPLAIRIVKFVELLQPFIPLRKKRKIFHSIQTNATLISPEWCKLFKSEEFRIGVSIDGDESQNSNRVNWADKSSFDLTMRGINLLKENAINFGIIAVINESNIEDPNSFYEFMVSTGCSSLSINIEEKEGNNREASALNLYKVKNFWQGLYTAWRMNPKIKIREFNRVFQWILSNPNLSSKKNKILKDLWLTIAWNGDVVCLSPEFAASNISEAPKFVVGNILNKPLMDIVNDAIQSNYVHEYIVGVKDCQNTCAYFSYCGGGHASNKYFELGRLDATETFHCLHSRQLLVDTVFESLINNHNVTYTERR